jgi:hypothetical protein
MKLRSGKGEDTPVENSTASSAQSEKSEEKPKATEDANKVMSGGRGDKVTEPEKEPSAIGGYNKSDNWIETEMLDDVTFQSEYIDIQFYVTDINHYVKEVEGSNNIVLKSTLTGSLSGYPGTYTLDIPYDKGIRLSVGTSFDVQVQVGECQGRTVIGEILY